MTVQEQILLESIQDKSVNIISETSIGYYEARYVRRCDKNFIVYLSSQSGCDQGCRFCHLTRTGQTKYVNATLDDFLKQAKEVFEIYKKDIPAEIVHFNFMARGEPLNNPNVNFELLLELGKIAKEYNLIPQFKISTIMPKSLDTPDLAARFAPITPDIYYSLYSMSQQSRDLWLPKAMNPNLALDLLTDYQNKTGKIIRIHWANIEGINSSKKELNKIINAINARLLFVHFNFVRYNPYDEKYGKEPPKEVIQENLRYLLKHIPKSKGQIIPRVGYDVHASCGMFYNEKKD